MLDLYRLHDQLRDFSAYRTEEDARFRDQLATALDGLRNPDQDWAALDAQIAQQKPRMLTASLRGVPTERVPGGPRPTPVTVVATDGSQIFPDRHVEPACYLLNIGRIAIQYGTEEPPLLLAEPELRFRRHDLATLRADDPDDLTFDVSAEVVSALRDERELAWLLDTALEQRRSQRPLVALVDGTLIRWMWRGMKHRALEEQLITRYLAVLDRFQAEGLPLASYISMPSSAEVVNLLRLARGEDERNPPDDTLQGLLDRHVFERVLEPGERSVLFTTNSHILDRYGPHRICVFYLRHAAEVARVEVPAWVADQPAMLDLLHAVLLDQCDKGGGYPIIIQEAHERAVVRAADRDLFYRVLERQLTSAGLSGYASSQKSASKRAPRI